MAPSPRRYSEAFKRQAVKRMTADPHHIPALARELDVARTLLYAWRKQYTVPPFSPLPEGEGDERPEVRASDEGPEVSAAADAALPSSRPRGAAEGGVELRQILLDIALDLARAIRETTASAPLNQLSAALGLVIDRLLRLEALAPRSATPAGQEVIRIEYLDPDGTPHSTPPWARDDSAFEEPVSRGRVRSPFWQDRDGQADDPGDGPARG